MALLFGLFFLFLIMGMPVAFCMMCSAVLYCTVFGESINMVLTRTIAGPSSFTLMALAFFILAGNIMNNGGVTDQIFGFCKKAVGWIPGGLGHANVLASVIFAGMSGAAVSAISCAEAPVTHPKSANDKRIFLTAHGLFFLVTGEQRFCVRTVLSIFFRFMTCLSLMCSVYGCSVIPAGAAAGHGTRL